MRLLLILAAAITLASGASRSYRGEAHSRGHKETARDRRANLDYDDIETADQDNVEGFEDPNQAPSPNTQSRSNTKSNRIGVGVYSTVNSIQISKSKPHRKLGKVGNVKDSEASGTHFEGTNFGGHFASPQVHAAHHHELLSSQAGLLPLYQSPSGPGGVGVGGNIVLGVPGLESSGAHGPITILSGGGNPGLQGPPPENELGVDITKSVYVFSAPPDPFDYVPRPNIPKLPPRLQKHIQLLYISPPSPHSPPHPHHPHHPPPPPPHHQLPQLPHHHQHQLELPLGTPQELKTLVYLLVKKPPALAVQPQHAPLPINFIKAQPSPPHIKPEVYFIRYKNRPFGLSSLPSPVDENPLQQFTPIAPQEELRGNIDYGPVVGNQFEGNPDVNSPYELSGYQEDAHISASQVLGQRSSTREISNGVS